MTSGKDNHCLVNSFPFRNVEKVKSPPSLPQSMVSLLVYSGIRVGDKPTQKHALEKHQS